MRAPTRPTPARGFTLIELLITIIVFGLMVAIGAWSGQRMLESYRTSDAAHRFAMVVRQAQALAAQNNQPVELTLTCDADAPRIDLTGTRWDSTSSAFVERHFERVAIADEFPGVRLSTVGLAGDVACDGSPTFSLDEDAGATFCGADQRLRFLPGGGVETPGGATMTIAFAPRSDVVNGRQDRVQVVGLEPVTGRTRHFVRADGTWECR